MADIYSFEPLWGVWRIEKLMGSGSYGSVYSAMRTEFGQEYRAAIKHISIPMNESELQAVYDEGYASDERSARLYYEQLLGDLLAEIRFMYKLKGNTHIVAYEDHMTLEKRDMPGYDIFIRMELLHSLNEIMRSGSFTPQEVCKLGIDICMALEILGKEHIVHRDIKPANILRNDLGDYKLGDFGVARQMERSNTIMSKKGTYTYMAPEVFKGEQASTMADIYSLGLVLHRLLNNNRAPFLPVNAVQLTHAQNEAALMWRLTGEKIPGPVLADEALGEIIGIACAYKPEKRFQTPMAFKNALVGYMESELCSAPRLTIERDRTTKITPPIRGEYESTEKLPIDGDSIPRQNTTKSSITHSQIKRNGPWERIRFHAARPIAIWAAVRSKIKNLLHNKGIKPWLPITVVVAITMICTVVVSSPDKQKKASGENEYSPLPIESPEPSAELATSSPQIAEGYRGRSGDFIYETTADNTIRILEYSGYNSAVTIPDKIRGLSVSAIGVGAFEDNEIITSVTLPEGIKAIEDFAFFSCNKLSNVSLPEGLLKIGQAAFHGCGPLNSISIPDSVTDIEAHAFCGTNWHDNVSADEFVIVGQDILIDYNGDSEDVDIPEGVRVISSGFHHNETIRSVNMPDSVKMIAQEAFFGCTSLKDITIPANVEEIGAAAFWSTPWLDDQKDRFAVAGPDILLNIGSNIEKIHIPDMSTCAPMYGSISSIETVEFAATTKIDRMACRDCSSLINVDMPYVIELQDYAFLRCAALQEIEIPETVESIGMGVFADCSSLKQVSLPDGITSIKRETFTSCSSLWMADIPDSVTTIERKAFYNCTSLTYLPIPDSVTYIAPDAFEGCDSLVISVDEYSYAHTWAIANDVAYRLVGA